jgi:hypothetical protein
MFNFRSFSFALGGRIALLAVAVGASVAVFCTDLPVIWSILLASVAVLVARNLFHYVNDTNRRLARCL